MVRGAANKTDCNHKGLILPVLGAGAFLEGSEEPSQVSKQGSDRCGCVSLREIPSCSSVNRALQMGAGTGKQDLEMLAS